MLPSLLENELIIKPKTNLDRYGFSYLLAERLGFSDPPKPFCDWIHGWAWWQDSLKAEDLIGPKPLSRARSIIVNSAQEKDILEMNGYTSVFIGGLPFAYVPNEPSTHRANHLLAFIAHSAEVEKMEVMDIRYLDYLAAEKIKYEAIYVSVYSLDQGNTIKREIERRKLIPVRGANPSDRRSLLRTKIALQYCKYVSTNTFGSHIAYALACGCAVSIFSPLYIYDGEKYLNTFHGHSREYADRMMYVSSEPYLKSRWPNFFSQDTKAGITNTELGQKYIGSSNVLKNYELLNALGWTTKGQFLGYASGGFRRIRQAITKW